MNRRSTCKQSGFFHIQSFIIFVLVIGVISSIGLYVLHKSKAGSNPYANGVIYSGYQQYNLTAQGVQTINTPSSFYSVAQAALPNDCPGIWSNGQKQTWNATKAAISCASNSSDTSHGYLSLVTVNTNYTSPTIIKKDKILTAGSPLDVGAYQITSQAFIKDGSISKVAFTDVLGTGTATEYKIGIYDVASKTTTYLKDETGNTLKSSVKLNAVDWTPDNTKLYLIQDDYRDNMWKYKVCSIPVAGGKLNCVTPTGTDNDHQSDPMIWSYDLSSLYYRSFTTITTSTGSNSVGDIVKYSSLYGNITKVTNNTSGQSAPNTLSPDGLTMLVTFISSGNGPWIPQTINTTTNAISPTTMSSIWDANWQVNVNTGNVTTTPTPDSGPILTSNYSVVCKATFGRLQKGIMPVTVSFTNNGPDATPNTNTGVISMVTSAGTTTGPITLTPNIAKYGSYYWSTQAGPFKPTTKYTLNVNYNGSTGVALANCGTTTFTTR